MTQQKKLLNAPIVFTTGLLTGSAIGILGLFFLDPAAGRRRRARVRDQLVHLSRVSREQGGRHARDLRNRAKGLIHQARKAVLPHARHPENARPSLQ